MKTLIYLYFLLPITCLCQFNQVFHSNDSTFGIVDCHFYDSNNGLIAANVYYNGDNSGIILKTDGNYIWDTIRIFQDTIITDLEMVGDSIGYVSFHANNSITDFGLFRTNNQGTTWTILPNVLINTTPSLAFINDSIGVFSVDFYSGLTLDGGVSWADVSGVYNSTNIDCEENIFISARGGYYSFSNDTMQTSDFRIVSSQHSVNGVSLDIVGLDTVIVLSALGVNGFDYGYSQYNFSIIYILENHDTINMTEVHFLDHYVSNVCSFEENIYACCRGLSDPSSKILKSVDNGFSWNTLELIDSVPTNSYAFRDIELVSDSVLYAFTWNSVYVSTNSGGAPVAPVGNKINYLESTDFFEEDLKLVQIYPNPHKDYFTIEAEKNAEISVFSTSGTLILTSEMHADKESINTSQLESGMYYIQIKSKLGSITKKIIKE